VSDELTNDRAQPLLEMWTLNILQELHEKPHEGRIDQSVRDIGIENNGLEVNEYVQLVIDRPT